jgi:general secretion pathway protein A
MYCNFYGFSERPFEVTPDPKFLYSSPVHREVLASLIYGIRERRGFIAVVGEAGTGKTTLLRSLLDRLEEEVKVAFVFNTDVTFDEMLQMVLMDLGLAGEKERLTKAEAIHRLNELAIRQLSRGGNLVIIVDEAQDLDRRCMENLRLLSNLETSKNKLIQIILSGQPELEEKLKQHDLRQLSQRINLRGYILPLDEKETYEYIRHRLKIAQYKGAALFSREAEKLIWQYSGGIPRKVNTVCDNALLIGYALKDRKIKEDKVREVIDDLTRDRFIETPGARLDMSEGQGEVLRGESPRHRLAILLVLVSCLALIAGAGLGMWGFHWKEMKSFSSRSNLRAMIPDIQKSASSAPIPPPHSSLPDPVREATGPPLIPNPKRMDAKLERSVEAKQEPVVKRPLEVIPVIFTKKGDSLSRIIKRNYGTYNKVIERKVLAANPDIKSPNLIYIQQAIRLPDLPQPPTDLIIDNPSWRRDEN